jgi:PST family polysaccharide transporter
MTTDPDVPRRFAPTVVRGASLISSGYLLTQLITLGSYVILARLAGPAVFGAVAAAWLLIGVGTLFSESGMSAALIQRDNRLDEAAATAVLSTFLGGMALSLIALALSPLVGLYFHSSQIGLLAAALSGVLLINAATVVPDALMRRRFSVVRRVVIDPLNAFIYGLAGVVALSAGMGAWGLIIAIYAAGCFRAVAVWVANRWLPDFHKASFGMWRELASYARHVVASQILRRVGDVATTAVIGRILGTTMLGQYRFGWRMANQVGMPVAVGGMFVLLPAFARMATDTERLRAAFLRSARLLSLLVLPISFALIPLGEPLTVALLGEPWREAGHVLAALTGVTAALPFITLGNELFKAVNRPDLLPRVTLVRTVGMLLSIAVVVPLGVVGVASGMSIAFLLAALYGLRHVAQVLTVSAGLLAAQFAAPALASAVMALGLFVFVGLTTSEDQAPLIRATWLVTSILLGTTAYFGIIVTFSKTAAEELKSVLHILRRSRSTGLGADVSTAADTAPEKP